MDHYAAQALFEAFRGDTSTFLYSGNFHDEHTAQLITLAEHAGPDQGSAKKGRLAFILVEAYQNIVRHRATLPPGIESGAGRSLFLLSTRLDSHLVLAVNAIRRDEVPKLQQALGDLAGKDQEALRQLFLSGLRTQQDVQRRGAGLGLIEMTRRSGSDLGYTLRGLGPELALFILAVRLGNLRDAGEVLDLAAIIHGTTVMNDLIVLHVGPRGPAVTEALLRVVEEDGERRTERSAQCGRAYLAACGALEEGADASTRWVFTLANNKGHHDVVMGRPMSQAQQQTLAERVLEVGRCDRNELDRRYRRALLSGGGNKALLDLMELARISVDPLEWRALPMEGGCLGLLRAVV